MSLIELKDINKSYILGETTLEVLRGIDLKIEEGEFVSIMGQSGSGKSTMMNIIGMLDNPTRGTYLFNSRDVSELTDDDQALIRRQSIGFIFQNYNLLKKTTAIKQVMLPLMYQGVGYKARYKKAYEALVKVGLEDKIHSVPSELSGGQQQRIAIARALVTDPLILLGDEPTGALDSHTGDEIMELLVKLHEEGKTIIIITHTPEVDIFAKRHIFLKDGEIIRETINK